MYENNNTYNEIIFAVLLIVNQFTSRTLMDKGLLFSGET